MIIKYGHTIKKVFSIVMIIAIGFFVVNKSFYMHMHKLQNGKVVSHAHPYNKTNDSQPYKTHHHSKAEFLFFEYLHLFFLAFSSIVLSLFVIEAGREFGYKRKIYFGIRPARNLGRAPPF